MASGFQPGRAIGFGQAQQPEARAVSLLWHGARSENGAHHIAGVRTDLHGPSKKAPRVPGLQPQLLRGRQVGWQRSETALFLTAHMHGYALLLMKEFDARDAHTRIY